MLQQDRLMHHARPRACALRLSKGQERQRVTREIPVSLAWDLQGDRRKLNEKSSCIDKKSTFETA